MLSSVSQEDMLVKALLILRISIIFLDSNHLDIFRDARVDSTYGWEISFFSRDDIGEFTNGIFLRPRDAFWNYNSVSSLL